MARFGPQGWWPVTPRGGSGPAYFTVRRPLRERERFEICAGAMLTQNTAWTNAARALAALNEAGALEPAKIAAMPQARLERLIRSSGYYRQKAARLKEFCSFILVRRGGLSSWLKSPLGPLRRELLAMRGIGPETADSILLYAGRRRVFVIDAYTLRFAGRMGWLIKPDYARAQKFLAESLPRAEKVYNEYHALIVGLAKKYCAKSRPSCGGCPLGEACGKHGVSR